MSRHPLCGVCGRQLGPFLTKRGQVEYRAWLHIDTSGLVPHAATIGVPGRHATVEEMTAALGDPDAARDLFDLLYGREAKPKRIHLHREELPPPRVAARIATEEEIPRVAQLVRNVAVEHGWDVRPVYALGPFISAEYQVIREVESLSLRMHRGGQRLVAIWERIWSPKGPVMVTKRTKCAGCKTLDCEGCALGTGAVVEEFEAKWEHDSSWMVRPLTDAGQPVKLSDLKAALVLPEAYCGQCGQVLGAHVADPRAGYVCPIQSETEVA